MAFQSTLCWLVQAWAAIPLLESCIFTTFLCSLRRFSRVLLVSPMYTHSYPGTELRRQHLSSFCFQRAASFALGHFSLHSQWLACPFDLLAESRDIRKEQQLGGCLAGLGGVGRRGLVSKVSLDHSLRKFVGPKHLSQVFDLLPLCAAITHPLSSVSYRHWMMPLLTLAG